MRKLLFILGLFASLSVFGQGVNVLHTTSHPITTGDGGLVYDDSTLTCTSSGTTFIPSTQVYGIWEYDLLKGRPNTGNMRVQIIGPSTSTNASGAIRFAHNVFDHLQLQEAGANFMEAENAGPDDVWFRIRIERNETENEIFTGAADAIRMSIQTTDEGSWTVVPVDSGTNPFTLAGITSSTNFVFDGDFSTGGDVIRNILIDGEVVDVGDFTDVSGSYTVGHDDSALGT